MLLVPELCWHVLYLSLVNEIHLRKIKLKILGLFIPILRVGAGELRLRMSLAVNNPLFIHLT